MEISWNECKYIHLRPRLPDAGPWEATAECDADAVITLASAGSTPGCGSSLEQDVQQAALACRIPRSSRIS